jgi:hypothetical protein
MVRKACGFALLGIVFAAAPILAQATGTPSYNAPYRAFTQSEFGGTLSFPDPGGTAIEGQYRFGYQTFDIGLRGGALFPGGGASNVLLLGIEARDRVITHTTEFPLDGAIVFGAGLNSGGGTGFIAPVGLSLGRRLLVQGSQVSIVPYVQPTGFLVSGYGAGTHLRFALGLGADFRLSQLFDARLSVGVGDNTAPARGVAISAVWVH